MSDREVLELTALLVQTAEIAYSNGEVLDHEDYAAVVIEAGWVHWPLHPTVDKLTAALNDERELHRDTRTENAALRRRLVELAALDPAEQVSDD